MIALGRALNAETLKLKRTLAVWLALFAPLGIAALTVLLYVQRADDMINEKVTAWYGFVQQNAALWLLLMLPLFVTLETALLTQMEHGHQTWKQLYALPLPRWAVYAAKQFATLIVIGLSQVIMGALILG